MATTDAKSGFRLPWSSDRPTDATDEATGEHAVDGWSTDPAADSDGSAVHGEADAHAEPATEGPHTAEPPETESHTDSDEGSPAPKTTKKQNKFLADLTKAMQAAAEDARGRALTQLQADAKTHIESIHGRSATEAADLRRNADDDVAAIREWSKAEIARIREETEQRITDRKGRLETEIEQHAAVIEREIEAVQGLVGGFEDEMAVFFERLLGEEDPTRFATMAENLPEPPSFDDLTAVALANAAAAEAAREAIAAAEPGVELIGDTPAESVAETTEDSETTDAVTGEAEATDEGADTSGTVETAEESAETTDTPEAGSAEVADVGADATVAEAAETEASAETGEPTMDGFAGYAGTGEGVDGDGEMDREAAFAAIQAAAEAAASAEVAADAAARAEAVADVAIEIIGNHDGEAGEEQDPRYAALGLTPDFDAAEAEAMAAANPADGDEIPEIGNDALAARLAGLVPTKGKGAAGDATSTQVVVTGLVSVASIASFKRHLGRVSGVHSVGVSSGPDGEFIFAVNHSADTNLRDAIPSLPSFQARVASSTDGVVHVTAHDPEADG